MSYGSVKPVRLLFAAMVKVVATGHLIQSIFSKAVLMMLISLTSCCKPPLAISHPSKATSPSKPSFEKLVRAGSASVVKLGRLFNVNVETASRVVDDIERRASELAMSMVPVTVFSPLSVMSWTPFPATEMFP